MVKVEHGGIVNGFNLICVSQLGLYCVARLKEQLLILLVNLFFVEGDGIRRGSAVLVREAVTETLCRVRFGVARLGLMLAEPISLSKVLFPLWVHGGQEDSEEGFGDLLSRIHFLGTSVWKKKKQCNCRSLRKRAWSPCSYFIKLCSGGGGRRRRRWRGRRSTI